MKNAALFLLLGVCCTDMTWGQSVPFFVPPPATKLEIFAARKNVVIATESYYLTGTSGDSGCSLRFQSLILYEARLEAQSVRGLKVEITERHDKDERSITSYVDFEELGGLSRAIATMLDLTQRGSLLPNPIAKEMSFSTAGGLTLTMIQRDRNRHLIVSDVMRPGISCTLSQSAAVAEFKAAVEMAMQVNR